MSLPKKCFLPFIVVALILNSSCNDNSESNTAVSENTANTNNTKIEGDTSKKDVVEDLVKASVDLVKEGIAEKHKNDSIRNVNEPRIWVYQIGESYDDDDLVAKAYDQLKETDSDIYVFRKKRKEYYLFMGIGISSKETLDDSLPAIQKRIPSRISIIDLSQLCRKLPTNTDPIKYKINKEKKYADCKTCE